VVAPEVSEVPRPLARSGKAGHCLGPSAAQPVLTVTIVMSLTYTIF
jgi:hypothetical protein